MKRFISSLAAAVISLLSVTSVTANANTNEFSNSSDVVSGWTEGLIPLDEKYRPLYDYSYVNNWFPKNAAMYIDDNGGRVRYIYPLDITEETVTLAEGVSVEQANAVLKEAFKAFNCTPYLVEKDKLSDGTPCYEGVGSGDLHKIVCKHLKEKGMIGSYIVKTGFYEYDDYYFEQILNYDQYYDYMDEETFNEIASYIEENNIGKRSLQYDINMGEDVEKIVVNDNITLTEQLDTALEIYEKFGFVPCGISPEMVDAPSVCEAVDLYNAIDGDANTDGEVGIADATLILQAIGNPDKYSLTPQGEYNADIDYSGGVTPLDALEVQRKISNS